MKKLAVCTLFGALGAASLSACVANPDDGEAGVTITAKGGGDADPDEVILDGAITGASGPNVSSPWVTIHGITSVLIVNGAFQPSQEISVTCHETSFTSVAGYVVGTNIHARCDNHQSALYISDLRRL
jgi:hypothetical protein